MFKRTPLFSVHQKLGGKLVEFEGWEMPVQYSSIVDEHLCVRRSAGIFDISHMGELLVQGPDAAGFLNSTLSNNAAKLEIGQGQYTLMCNEQGGVVDDLYAYHTGKDSYLLIINASRIDADYSWINGRLNAFLRDHPAAAATVTNISEETGAAAIQGPRVKEFIDLCFSGPSSAGLAATKPTDLVKNRIAQFHFADAPVWVARTGYTGEDGFEVVAPSSIIELVWSRVMDTGHIGCLQPCGLGARDTLRTEVCYPLYGHELDEKTTPIEAGLGSFVDLNKGEFLGRAVLLDQKTNGVRKKCVAFKMAEKSPPPRPHYSIWGTGDQAARIGEVVSGTQSPSLEIGVGMGYVPPDFARPGTGVEIEIRGKRWQAIVVPKPIYKKPV